MEDKKNIILTKNGFKFKKGKWSRDDGYVIYKYDGNNIILDGMGNTYIYKNDYELIGFLALHGLIIIYC